jgi:hypothetical protein
MIRLHHLCLAWIGDDNEHDGEPEDPIPRREGMTAALIAMLLASVQTPVQQDLTAGDARMMVQTVLDSIVPEGGTVHGDPVSDRPLFLDVGEIHDAFAPVVDELDRSAFDDLGRPFSDRTVMGVIRPVRSDEDEGMTGRTIENDGIFVSILRVDSADDGEYLLEVRLRHGTSFGQRASTTGYEAELFLGRTDDGWEVLRWGDAIAG